jgi:hypothetical protein
LIKGARHLLVLYVSGTLAPNIRLHTQILLKGAPDLVKIKVARVIVITKKLLLYIFLSTIIGGKYLLCF